eukprot:INCI13107.3.p1 GENE.INCI13107.3~~INCI13107.3.p1  ORF type:complete len:188 (+),score=31.18 INCI13107.3:144-707(+)
MGDMTFTRAYLRVPTGTLHALRAAIADDSVARVQKLFDELVVGNEGVDIDTTVYAEENGPHSLYYERLDGFHTRGNQCTILQFSLLQISPKVARWAVRDQCANPSLVYKIACPQIVPSGTRLRLKMSYVGVAELLAPSAGRYLTTKAVEVVAEKFIEALKASLTEGEDLDKAEFAAVMEALGVQLAE